MQGGLNSKMFEVALKANRGARLKYATSVRKATVEATPAKIHSSKTGSLAEPTPPLEGLYSGTRDGLTRDQSRTVASSGRKNRAELQF